MNAAMNTASPRERTQFGRASCAATCSEEGNRVEGEHRARARGRHDDAGQRGSDGARDRVFIVGDDLELGRLRTVLSEYEPPAISLSALFPRHRHLSAKTRLFVEYLFERCGDRPWV